MHDPANRLRLPRLTWSSRKAITTGGASVAAAALLLASSQSAQGVGLRAVYTVIPSSPTSNIPGARDLAGQPAPAAKWLGMLALSVRQNADEWVVRGTNNLGPDLTNSLVRGQRLCGDMLMQEGQPIQGGGAAGELYDFFDSPPVMWNTAGVMAYSFRARGGVTSDDEKIGTFNGASHSLILQQGSSLTGLTGCTAPAIGNSVGSVHMLDTGEVAFGNTPITGCPSTNYPALFKNNVGFVQCGVTLIVGGAAGEENVDDLSYDQAAFTPDGLHYADRAFTNNPNSAQDRILLIDGDAVLREGTALPGSSIILAEIFKVRYANNTDWYARGDDPLDNDWAVRNGVLLAATGQPITTGATEHWGAVFSTFFGDRNGNWYIVGNTDNPSTSLDTVLVRNGTDVLARENDPVDVDGNGQFDDDAVISTFKADSVYITDSGVVYILCTLRTAAGTNLGDALVRGELAPVCAADIAPAPCRDGAVNVADLLAVISAWGPCASCPPAHCAADIAPAPAGDCSVNVADLLAVISAWGACP